MDKILLLTGGLAEKEVRAAADALKADVLVFPVNVAQFISQKMAVGAIKKLNKSYTTIIFPGLTRFDVSEVEKEVKVPCFKGPKHPSDLPELLKKKVKLSKKDSADKMLEKDGLKEYQKVAKEAEKREAALNVGNLKVGPDLPPRIVAEIVDAPSLTDQQILAKTRYYLDNGADIIDVGAIASEDNSKRLGEIVSMLKRHAKSPISIDSLNPKEINSALEMGADLVLSLTSKNVSVVRKSDNTCYVLIPDEKTTLDGIIEKSKELGFKNLIADPILHPPFHIAESITAYHDFRKSSNLPMLMGASNVVELMDADSIGMNAVLAAIAVELEISLILITENSEKTRNSVREMRRALDMCFLAKEKGTLPKDLGINLLLAKAKHKSDIFDLPDIESILAEPKGDFIPDPQGHFKISLDFDKDKIIVMHCKGKCENIFEGDNAEALSKFIIEKGLISRLDHAAYLGRELQKAETYLKLKKSYTQDEDFLGL